MKIFKFALLIIAVSLLYSGCDDSGFQSTTPKGLISFSSRNLQHIDPNIDGNFELWLRLDSAGHTSFYSLGRFNINTSGAMVDTAGSPMNFQYRGDTNRLYQSTAALLTLEQPGNYSSEPSSQILLSGIIGFSRDSLYANLTINGSYALGSSGQAILTSTGAAYVINTPTAPLGNCLRGVWLCDTNEASHFPSGMQLNAPGWVYEAWLKDKSNANSPIYYSMGRFRDPFASDFDGAGSCAGTGPHYNKPGQDWVQDSCPPGKPSVQDINNGNYEILVTLEPSNEQSGSAAFNSPFWILYKQATIVVNCRRWDNLFVQAVPSGKLKITYRE